MLVRCRSNRPSTLAPDQRMPGATDDMVYHITPGHTYPVVGISMWERTLCLLIADDHSMLCATPAGFFDLGVWEIPAGWHFKLDAGVRAWGKDLLGQPSVALWGYPELVDDDPAHITAIYEQEPEALAIFQREVDRARQEG